MAAKATPLVRKGDPVELFVETGSFSVSTNTVAQEDGAMGDRIRVRSDPKAPVMIAEVVDGGRVRVPGFK
jgi:flagella basal body P-ring formation protein FlgA